MTSLEIIMKTGIYMFMIVGTLAALGTVLFPNLFHAGLSMALVLLCVSGLYVSAGSEFLAMVQILIYVGAVMTLVIYAIMLTNLSRKSPSHLPRRQTSISLIAIAAFAALTGFSIMNTKWNPIDGLSRLSAKDLGTIIMTKYIFPFEVLGIILFAVLIGAIVIARRDPR